MCFEKEKANRALRLQAAQKLPLQIQNSFQESIFRDCPLQKRDGEMEESDLPDFIGLARKFFDEFVGGITLLKLQLKNFFVGHLEIIIDLLLTRLSPHI